MHFMYSTSKGLLYYVLKIYETVDRSMRTASLAYTRHSKTGRQSVGAGWE